MPTDLRRRCGICRAALAPDEPVLCALCRRDAPVAAARGERPAPSVVESTTARPPARCFVCRGELHQAEHRAFVESSSVVPRAALDALLAAYDRFVVDDGDIEIVRATPLLDALDDFVIRVRGAEGRA